MNCVMYSVPAVIYTRNLAMRNLNKCSSRNQASRKTLRTLRSGSILRRCEECCAAAF